MKATLYGVLTGEDLARWRLACSRFQALEMNPRAYSAQEAESILMRYYTVFEEARKSFSVPDDASVRIAPTTGAIVEDND